MTYIIKTQCKEASNNGHILTQEGVWVWVCEEEGGWVEATAYPVDPSFPFQYKIFKTEQDALKFIKRWKGHPWYYKPNGVYEIVKVEPKYKTVLDGWEIK